MAGGGLSRGGRQGQHAPVKSQHPALEGFEPGRRGYGGWRRRVGGGCRGGLGLGRAGKAEAGRKGGGTAAKRLARAAEWAYVWGNTGSGDTMAEAAFNTIAEIQRLRDAGLPQEQAEAITLSIHSGVTGGVATKADLERVEERLGGEIKLVHKDIAALDTKIDTGLAALDDKIDVVKEGLEAKIGAVDQKIDSTRESLEAKMEKQTAQLGEQIANGFAAVAERQVVQMRWMIASIIGSIGVLVAAYAAFQ